MNTLELKGGMIEMIAGIKNPEILQRLYHIIEEIMIETEEDVMELAPEQEARLDADLAASEKEENLVSHQEAIKTMSRWLN